MDITVNSLIDNKNNLILSVDRRLFWGLMLMCCFYLFVNPVLKLVGATAIITIFLLCIYDLLIRSNKIKINHIWLWYFVFVIYSLISLVKNPTVSAMYCYALEIALLLLICLYSSTSLKEKAIKSIFSGGKIVFFILLLPALAVIFKGEIRLFNDYFSFTIYKIMLPCTFFFLAKSKNKLPKIIIFSSMFFAMGERAAFLSLVIVYIVYLILGRIKYSKFIYKTFFVLVSLCILLFPYIYVKLQYTDLGLLLNNLSRQYTGANLFSGRHRIREIAFNYILAMPILGYGFNNNILALHGISLSTHNLYVYLLLQGGIIAIMIFLLIMYSIWKRYFDGLKDDIVRMSAAYFIGIMFFASFELTLIINSVTISIFLWLIIGMGLIQRNNLFFRRDS